MENRAVVGFLLTATVGSQVPAKGTGCGAIAVSKAENCDLTLTEVVGRT
jgi:hypothetical protein